MPVGDVYEQLLHKIATDSHALNTLPLSIFTPQRTIPRLSALAITTLATWWQHVEDLGTLPSASLAALGSELSKQRKLSPQAVQIMFPTTDTDINTDINTDIDIDFPTGDTVPVHRSVLLSDCSALNEECIFDVIMGAAPHLESLDLKNVGHVFTSHLVDRLVAASSSSSSSRSSNQSIHLLSLQELVLTGMYRLQDVYLTKFFTHLLAPNRMHTLNLSKNSCLAHDGVMTLLQCGLFSQLTTLILDCTLLHGAAMAVVTSEENEEDDEESTPAALRGRAGAAKLYQENAITILCR